MNKKIVSITVVGKDKEGIVAAFTSCIFKNRGNIEKINQNVIKGLFGMYITASFNEKKKLEKLHSELNDIAEMYKMEVNLFNESNTDKNIAILATKEIHCVNTILNASIKNTLKGKVCVVVGTSKSLCDQINLRGIPFFLIEDKEQANAEEKLLTLSKKYKIDLIVLARYMRILTPNFVWRYPNRIINIHPSLLPSFPGANAYAQAYERGTKIIGVTAHYVTENLDQGPIIIQDSFKIKSDDSFLFIKNKGQKLEAKTLLTATKLHLENKLVVSWRKVHIKN